MTLQTTPDLLALTLFDTIEPDFVEALQVESAEQAAQTALSLGALAVRFARIERVPRYDACSRENDVEHSFMLSLVATELAAQYFPDLDLGTVAQFGTVHDLVEVETGDVPTFTLDQAGLAAKAAAEHAAMETLHQRLPAYTFGLLRRYEAQVEPEARFVRLVDKILPVIVNIVGPGRKVMVEDYDIMTGAELARNEARVRDNLRDWFPETELAFVHMIRDILATQFAIGFSWEHAPVNQMFAS